MVLGEKRLVIKVLTTAWCKLLRIVEQTHRGEDFGINGNFFEHKGFVLRSLDNVGMKPTANGLYVFPYLYEEYDKIIVVPSDTWLERCIQAVRAYNRFFSGENYKLLPGEDIII